MSSIICNRNGVIEVSLGSSKPARWRRPLQGYPQLRRHVRERTHPYGEAVQSNVFYQE